MRPEPCEQKKPTGVCGNGIPMKENHKGWGFSGFSVSQAGDPNMGIGGSRAHSYEPLRRSACSCSGCRPNFATPLLAFSISSLFLMKEKCETGNELHFPGLRRTCHGCGVGGIGREWGVDWGPFLVECVVWWGPSFWVGVIIDMDGVYGGGRVWCGV